MNSLNSKPYIAEYQPVEPELQSTETQDTTEAQDSTTETQAEADMVVFNPESLYAISEGDMSFEKELIGDYKKSVLENFVKLENAFKKNDQKEAVLYSHDIKGSSSNFGANFVCKVSAAMEESCKQGNLETVSELLPDLKIEIDKLITAFNDYLAESQDVVERS